MDAVLQAALAAKAWPELRPWILRHFTDWELGRALYEHWRFQRGSKK